MGSHWLQELLEKCQTDSTSFFGVCLFVESNLLYLLTNFSEWGCRRCEHSGLSCGGVGGGGLICSVVSGKTKV